MVLCFAAVAFRHSLDFADVAVVALGAVAFSAAVCGIRPMKNRGKILHILYFRTSIE